MNLLRSVLMGLPLLLLNSALASAQVPAEAAIQAPTDILAAAETHLKQAAAAQHDGRIDITLGRLDARLRLRQCTQALQAELPSGARLSGTTSVAVSCPDLAGWKIYVSAEIDIFGPALVTTRSLARGTPLTPGDVQSVETKLTGLSQGHLQTAAEVEGMALLRAVPAGTVLTPSMVKAPRLVRRGDRVMLVSGQGPIQVEMLGEAVNDGARGDRIRVRALNSKRVIEGWVVSPSVVKVTL